MGAVVGTSPGVDGFAAEVFGDRLAQAVAYAELLAHEGCEWGLIGPVEADRIWERHILNSLCVSPLIVGGSYVADAGSGAGLPGIPLAIARPDCRVDLVEPMQRRVDFLDLCVRRLELGDRVRVVRSRVEDYRDRPTVVTCRAVARLARLIPLVDGVVPPGVLVAIKGDQAEIEVTEASSLLVERGLQADVVRPLVGGRVVGTVVRVGRPQDLG